MMNKKGFTLIEMLVVVAIVGLIVGFMVTFITSITRGGANTNLTTEIKQNGNYALEVMSYYIRNARSIKTCASDSIILTQWDNSETTFSLLLQDNTNYLNSRIASGLATLVPITNADKNTGVQITAVPLFSCDLTKIPPVVNIKFSVSQSFWASSKPEYAGSAVFQTSVSLRTY